jgi:holo-[acyl-carrier protein] synthase
MLYCGIDLIEVARVRAALERHGDHFVKRVFTPAEIAHCGALADPWPHWAARFAAKEAVFKALPDGVLEALVWREIGVWNLPSGRPQVDLHGDTAARLAGWSFALSLSHVRQMAVAQVIAQPPARDRTP